MLVREADAADMVGIAAIYNDAAANTTAIWNDKTVDAANRLQWFSDRQQAGFPVLVAVAPDGKVIGYASFGDWRSFDGYRHTVEHSVYVDKDCRGTGVGIGLMEKLIERARTLSKHVMIAAVEAENLASIRLHKRLGFEEVALMREVGTKFGRWLDLMFLQLKLDDGQPR